MIRLLTSWAGRLLAQRKATNDRERIRAKARQMRVELGLPPSGALQ